MEENLNSLNSEESKLTLKEEGQHTRKINWRNILVSVLSVLILIAFVAILLFIFSFIGECCDRNKHIRSVEPVVVTEILDNTVREYSDGDIIYPTTYSYVLFLSDSLGRTIKMTVPRWAPWANDSDRYDSTMVNIGDTVSLYKFGSKGFFNFYGDRRVIGKNGRYYE